MVNFLEFEYILSYNLIQVQSALPTSSLSATSPLSRLITSAGAMTGAMTSLQTKTTRQKLTSEEKQKRIRGNVWSRMERKYSVEVITTF